MWLGARNNPPPDRAECPLWVMCGRRRLGKNFLSCCSIGRVRSCVRPVLCGGEAAGHNALRGSGPNQKHAFKDALTQTGSPDPGSTLSALRRHVLANSFKLQTPSSFPGLTSLNCSGFDANQSIALRCRRVGAVHSINLFGTLLGHCRRPTLKSLRYFAPYIAASWDARRLARRLACRVMSTPHGCS